MTFDEIEILEATTREGLKHPDRLQAYIEEGLPLGWSFVYVTRDKELAVIKNEEHTVIVFKEGDEHLYVCVEKEK